MKKTNRANIRKFLSFGLIMKYQRTLRWRIIEMPDLPKGYIEIQFSH